MEKVNTRVDILLEVPLVQAGDCDFNRSLSPPALFRRMQESAYSHAARLGLDSDSVCTGHFHWVLGRMGISLTGPLPQWKDSWEIRTWITGYDRLFAYRSFSFSKGGVEFGSAVTSWILIDAQLRKPVSPGQAFDCRDLDFPGTPAPAAKRLRALQDYQWSQPQSIGYRDVDLHNHVNNTRYPAYFLDRHTRAHFESFRLRELHLNFLQELVWGDEFSTGIQENAQGCFSYAVRRQDGGVCALGESLWEPMPPKA